MKIIKKSPFKMKYQSPLNQNGDDKVVSSAGGTSILQENPKQEGVPWSTLTDEDIKKLEGGGKPPPEQFYKGQRVYPNKNVAWQTPQQIEETTKIELDNPKVPNWESKITSKEQIKLQSYKGQGGRIAIKGNEYYKILKAKYDKSE